MHRSSWLTRLIQSFKSSPRSAKFAASPVNPARHNQFQGASGVNERNVSQGVDWTAAYRDRYNYDREKINAEALLAWRLNPLARRIVEIQTQYTTDGIDFTAENEQTLTFLREFWNHPLNKIGEHLRSWADEFALTGNLFPAITTDRAGMSYLRVYPSDLIQEIGTRPNDIQQETYYTPKATAQDPDPQPIPNVHTAGKKAKTVMLHYAVNRLAGMTWGEPDLAPLLPWLARYASWLEDRVRLNRFRQAFLYVVKGPYQSEAEKTKRQAELMQNPPTPGSILVSDTSEEWSVLDPKLDSSDANNDGLALKKFIAGGRGYPLHWLAEPESSTRTTAEAAGTPTFKGLETRQQFFLAMLKDLLTIVAQRAGHDPAGISVTAADISERDNAALALASTQVITSFGQLWANGFIDDDEYMRVVYRFAGEVIPADRPDNPKPKTTPKGAAPAGAENIKVDSETGDVRVKEPK